MDKDVNEVPPFSQTSPNKWNYTFNTVWTQDTTLESLDKCFSPELSKEKEYEDEEEEEEWDPKSYSLLFRLNNP